MSRHHRALDRRRWAAVRWLVINRDGWRCRGILPDGTTCARPGRLECDHIRPLESFPDQDPFDPAGLQMLCRSCHFAKTNAERIAKLPPDVQAWRNRLKATKSIPC